MKKQVNPSSYTTRWSTTLSCYTAKNGAHPGGKIRGVRAGCTEHWQAQIMTQSDTPPYLRLDPDAAAAALGAPYRTTDFETIAEACAAGREALMAQGQHVTPSRSLRRFSTWEITR
jgi:hypothetical protein